MLPPPPFGSEGPATTAAKAGGSGGKEGARWGRPAGGALGNRREEIRKRRGVAARWFGSREKRRLVNNCMSIFIGHGLTAQQS